MNLAVYSEFACSVEFASHDEAEIFEPGTDWEPPGEEAEQKPWNNMGNNQNGGGWMKKNDGW